MCLDGGPSPFSKATLFLLSKPSRPGRACERGSATPGRSIPDMSFRNPGFFSPAKSAIGLSWLAAVAAFVLLRLGHPALAKLLEDLMLVLNFVPAAAALLVCGLLILLRVDVRAAMLVWPLLTLVLGVPFWLWFEKGWRRRNERKAAREAGRGAAADL